MLLFFVYCCCCYHYFRFHLQNVTSSAAPFDRRTHTARPVYYGCLHRSLISSLRSAFIHLSSVVRPKNNTNVRASCRARVVSSFCSLFIRLRSGKCAQAHDHRTQSLLYYAVAQLKSMSSFVRKRKPLTKRLRAVL